MAGVDDAEPVAFGVGEDDEVRIGGVLPCDSFGAERDESVDLGGLLVRGVDDEVDVDARVPFGRLVTVLDGEARALARRVAEASPPLVDTPPKEGLKF